MSRLVLKAKGYIVRPVILKTKAIYNKLKTLVVSLRCHINRKINKLNQYIEDGLNIIFNNIPLWVAHFWQYFYHYKSSVYIKYAKHKIFINIFILVVLMTITWIAANESKIHIEKYFDNTEKLNNFKDILVSLGGALIGATAIAFSLIMFAMQVNVERMPHGLFRKFSSDRHLLGVFLLTFILSISITLASLIPDKSWIVATICYVSWSVLLVFVLLIISYKRALALISPTQQLSILVSDVAKNLIIWSKAAERTKPILRNNEKNNDEREKRIQHDIEKVAYFSLYPNWTAEAEKGISHCISYSRRFSEQGDHEVTDVALKAVMAINSAYIRAKGKTFFTHHYLIENPLATDDFINNTLEHLRQNIQIGIRRGDELQLEQTFEAMHGLCQIYINIDYSDQYATNFHAHMAAGYLTNAVEAVVPHNMPDVLMNGIRLMGRSAQLILDNKEPSHILAITEKMALIACAGTVHKDYRPVTQVAVTQLSRLTFELIRSQCRDVRHALSEIRGDIKLIVEMYLKIPDSPVSNIASSNLAPYYSLRSEDTLGAWLTNLTNAISDAKKGDDIAETVIDHIEEWADGLYQTEKELLLLTIEKKSGLTFDIIHWIVHITKLLLAVSCAEACDEHNRKELRNAARWLINVLSWIPDNEETIKFVEVYQIADQIFESSVDAKKRDCDETGVEIRDLLLGWMYKAGKYQTGWASLEKACCGLACLNIILGLPDEKLFCDIDEYLTKIDAPSFEIRSRTASDIHDEADKYRTGYGHGAIDVAMANVDPARLSELLHSVADHLLPEANST